MCPDEIYDTYVDIDSNLLIYIPKVPYFSMLNKLIFLISCVLPSLHKRDLKIRP